MKCVLRWMKSLTYALGFCALMPIVQSQAAVQGSAEDASKFDCAFAGRSGNTFCKVEETGLPLRLLTKPRANIYEKPDPQSNTIKAGLPTFTELIATDLKEVDYKENAFSPRGWFGVAYTAGTPRVGWISAQDVVEWHHGLVLTFTNPGTINRKPVIMFEDAETLVATLDTLDAGGTDRIDTFFSRIEDPDKADIPVGVISREPSSFVDFKEQFYLMPIIGKKNLSGFTPNADTWALQFAAATATSDGRAKGSCELQKGDDCDAGTGDLEAIDSFEIVFVVDMTVSMQPYIDSVFEAVKQSTDAIREVFEDTGPGKVRFGLVGYRDDVSAVPEMEWTSKNFTPGGLLEPKDFLDLVTTGSVVAAKADNSDFPEEVFAGVKDGIESAWSDDEGVRLLVLIGDASSHPLGAPRNTTQHSPESLRTLANESDVYVSALHIAKNPDDAPLAEEQFRTLASYQSESVSYEKISVGGGQNEGDSLTLALRNSIQRIASAVAGGGIEALEPKDDGGDGSNAVLAAARAAIVDYLGDDVSPPSNVVAWALDRDISDLSKPAFNIKVMVDRSQIEQLKNGLDTILGAFQAQESTTSDFFAGAQGFSTGTTMDLIGITDITRLGEATVLPSWINYLPYKSELMAMSVQDFKNSPPDDRRRTEERLERLIDHYDKILNTPSFWRSLNDQATGDHRVHFIDLDELP